VRLGRFVLLALAGGSAQTPGFAQDDVIVYSPRADSVAVTIYPDDLALITETRTVRLPRSGARLVIQDVADTLLPQSAVVTGLGRLLAESNFDHNRLTPESLLMHSIGQSVTLLRTDPATGAVSRIPARILAAAAGGVVFETADGNEALQCSGLAEGLVFEAIPDDLYATPQLSMELAPGRGGDRTIQLSYLAHGFAWSADYVAHLDTAAGKMDLAGWATVTNSSGKVFDQAELQLVAGQLNVLDGEDGGSRAADDSRAAGSLPFEAPVPIAAPSAEAGAVRLRDCFAVDPPEPADRRRGLGADLSDREYVIVTGARISREEFGDYHLYRLPWRTDLGARQTKQLLFLEQAGVTIDRLYQVFVSGILSPVVYNRGYVSSRERGEPSSSSAVPSIVIRTENTAAAGLGEPLPAGRIRVFETYDGHRILAGQATLADRPVGAPVEIEIARALDVTLDVDFRPYQEVRDFLDADYQVINAKSLPIDIEVRHVADEVDIVIEETSRPYEASGGFLVWRFVVAPGIDTLRYTLSSR
jgi:hypothetical protein